jgi:hypothetical protein
MTNVGKWTREVHGKARILHAQLAALGVKAQQANDPASLVAVLSEPYFRLLDELYTDELPWAQAMDNSDLVMRLKGPAADEDAPRLKLIGDTFDSLRTQVQKIAKSIAGVSSPVRGFPEDLDLGLSAFARGSVVLGLRVRTASDTRQTSLLDDQDPLLLATREAVRKLGEVARFVGDEKLDDEALKGEIPDPGVRDTILGAAAKLAPTGKRGIDSVELSVPDRPGQQLVMTPKTRTTIRQAMVKPVKRKETGEFTGVVRELDLDLQRFELRRMSGVPSLRCAYADVTELKAMSLMNATVRVSGPVEYGPDGSPRLLQVEGLEVIQAAPNQLLMHLDAHRDDGGL